LRNISIMRFGIAEILDQNGRPVADIFGAKASTVWVGRKRGAGREGELMREKRAGSNQEMRAFVGVPEGGLAVLERV